MIRAMPHCYDPDLQTKVLVLPPDACETGTWMLALWIKLSQKDQVPLGLCLVK